MYQKRFASDDPSERHPALEQEDLRQAVEEEALDEPIQPQAQSAEAFDISDIQPTDAREVPQPELYELSEQDNAARDQEPQGTFAAPQPGQDEAFASGLTSGNARGFGQQASQVPKEGHQLYIGNLFFDVTEEDLRREFGKHGNVEQAKIVYDNRGLSKGQVSTLVILRALC